MSQRMPGWRSSVTVRLERGEDRAEGGGCGGRDALGEDEKVGG